MSSVLNAANEVPSNNKTLKHYGSMRSLLQAHASPSTSHTIELRNPGSLPVVEQITAPIDLYGTVGKADRNVDIPFPPEPRYHLHCSQTGLSIGFLECDRFRLRPGFSAQDEHAETQIGGFLLLIVLEQARAKQSPLALESGHVFLVRAAQLLTGWRV